MGNGNQVELARRNKSHDLHFKLFVANIFDTKLHALTRKHFCTFS